MQGDVAPAEVGSESPFDDPGIQTFPDEGNAVVPVGTNIFYNTDPPTSGTHYPVAQQAGFYTSPVAPGFLVQSMARGGVIIYYDAGPITAPNLDALRMRAEAHPGDINAVVVVPRPDPTFPVVLTAWTHMLPLTNVDLSRIDNFIALYLGKGPDNS
jgi:hypothetical protein